MSWSNIEETHIRNRRYAHNEIIMRKNILGQCITARHNISHALQSQNIKINGTYIYTLSYRVFAGNKYNFDVTDFVSVTFEVCKKVVEFIMHACTLEHIQGLYTFA